ncbi:MAG: endolytic transglycosylase MltG, partial [Thermodesulfovibrio sp.]|nr:endolytic transglycosylase MltG [Thermodesulfovibrio sp.]
MKIWKALLIVFIAYLIFIGLYVAIELTKPLKIKEEIEVYIPKGSSFTYIASTFKEKGIIQNELLFKITGRILGIEKRARAGYYLITKEMSLLEILEKLLRGKIIEYTLTIVEGDSLFEI